MKLKNKILISLVILFLVILTLNIKALATTGTVTEITVNVRKEASTNSDILMYVTQDDKVEIIEQSGEWYKIKYKNKTGYVSAKYVKVNEKDAVSENKDEQEQQEVTKDVEKSLKIINETEVRVIPNISSNVIYTSKEDVSINIIEQISGWTYISVNNVCGWIRTDKLIESDKEDEEDNTSKKIAYIKYSSVNLRKEASATSDVVEKLKLNDEITILEEVDSVWTKVKAGDIIGYISAELLSETKQNEKDSNTDTTSRSGNDSSRNEAANNIKTATNENKISSTTNSSIGEDIVAYAKKYLGYDYVYGGSTPKIGFDCSGFTSYVYKHFGYTLSRSSVAQANNGTKVEKKDLQQGDLLIFKNYSLTKIGHVGIYIGNNKFIHASEPGVGIIISDLSSVASRYPQRFVMGRRIVK